MHSNWRDCQEWRSLGVPLSTTSNEAAKLYDMAATQLLSYREVPESGGYMNTINSMKAADPNFVMGHVLSTGFQVMLNDALLHKDPELQTRLDAMQDLCKQSHATDRDKKFVQAVVHWANRDHALASEVYENILLDYPRDVVAITMAHLTCLFSGDKLRHKDLVSKVMPYWSASMPHYGFLQGIRAFGLVENNYFVEAERYGRQALEIYPGDGWATHSMAHVHDMAGRSEDGRQFMARSEKHWQGSPSLDHHNYWHWALMDIDQGDYESALDIYDTKIKPPLLQDKATFTIIDATSLLKRLQMEGVNVGDRWEDMAEIVRPKVDDHALVFDDLHLLLGSLGSQQPDITKHLMDSVEEFLREGRGDNHVKMKAYGADLLRAVVSYEDGDYGRTVELLYPIRYQVSTMGGSLAQVDIAALLLINAAIQSPHAKHHKIARQLIAERQTVMKDSPMTERLMTRAMACHID